MSTTTTTYQFILVERREAVTVLTVNRPDKLNAINRSTLEEIADAVRAFAADDAQGALIVTGSGPKAFIAGADIGELQPLLPAAAENISRFGQSVGAGRRWQWPSWPADCSAHRPSSVLPRCRRR